MRRVTASFTPAGERFLAPAGSAGPASIPVPALARWAPGWLLDGESRSLSPNTLDNRRGIVERLLMWLRDQEHTDCGAPELRAFLASLARKGARPSSVRSYHAWLRSLFTWLVSEDAIAKSPMDSMKPPVSQQDEVEPFTPEEIGRLITAAGTSRSPRRNGAILLLMLDTGLRASEVCSLKVGDVDVSTTRSCSVVGKGNKRRSVYFSGATAKALWQYLKEEPRDPGHPLFCGEGSGAAGDPMTRSGLLQLFRRLGTKAGVSRARCSPHTMRHSYAVMFLRAGGNTFSLQQSLGHTSLSMTRRYVQLVEADVATAMRQFSPVERLKRRGER